MKTIIFLILASATGLVFLTALSCKGWAKSGNGHVTTEEKTVTPFTKVSIEGVFPVVISQTGGSESVKVETDENLQDEIIVRNEGDKLIVKNKDHVSMHNSTKVKIYINIKKLSELNFNSVGNLSSESTLKLDSLELKSESVGKLDLDIDADFLRASLNAVGNTTLRGKVREARINNKSVGALSAFDLKAGTLMIHNTAIGSAEIYADSAFYIRSSAVGSVTYKGPGVVKELTSDGIGRVQKKD